MKLFRPKKQYLQGKTVENKMAFSMSYARHILFSCFGLQGELHRPGSGLQETEKSRMILVLVYIICFKPIKAELTCMKG